MAGIFYRNSHGVIENGGCMGKFDPMTPNIRYTLLDVPDHSHTIICILYVYVKNEMSVRMPVENVTSFPAHHLESQPQEDPLHFSEIDNGQARHMATSIC